MNDQEREIIILNSAWEMIDNMVNWAMFCKTEKRELSNLMFETNAHARLFLVLLGDFLSQVSPYKSKKVPLGLLPVPDNVRPSDKTFLFHLRQVCTKPHFGGNTSQLHEAVEAFASWLEGAFRTEGVNLHPIDVVADIEIERLLYLKMCGDISKHSLARLEANARRLRVILENAGVTIDEQQSYLGLETFFDWFFDGMFIYHSSLIAEFLNNIRWAIYDYLQPEFQRSYHRDPRATDFLPLYGYHVPAEVTDPIAFAMYWDAMNRSRRPPYFQRFTIPASFKTLY
ncbi:hypothetical protein [Citromicrobium bathyomarinum]|uniref:hypothetical protein n=1 Tax=Citromicrobium bathyomarinum TaxID=72174 RepID=UPI001E3F8E6E|nr:hypothetical protein [Citromicrobium bathyomarinum]MCD1624034.1 hypothetical protein [Citromicrobium bathyomarinum]